MRAAVLILVIFNLALLAALKIRHGGAPTHAPQALDGSNDTIQIIPMREAVTVVARCVELGPFSAQEAVLAQNMLQERALGEIASSVEVPISDGWWVYISPRASRADAIKRAREVEKLGVRDFHLFEDGPYKNAISLGVFRSEGAAAEYAGDLERRGLRNARIGRQEHRILSQLIYIRSQAPEVIASVTEVKAQFARAELRQVSCPDSARALPLARTN